MLKYINKMTAIHWMIVMIALFALFSVGKMLAVVGLVITFLCVIIKFWDKVSNCLKRLFNI